MSQAGHNDVRANKQHHTSCAGSAQEGAPKKGLSLCRVECSTPLLLPTGPDGATQPFCYSGGDCRSSEQIRSIHSRQRTRQPDRRARSVLSRPSLQIRCKIKARHPFVQRFPPQKKRKREEKQGLNKRSPRAHFNNNVLPFCRRASSIGPSQPCVPSLRVRPASRMVPGRQTGDAQDARFFWLASSTSNPAVPVGSAQDDWAIRRATGRSDRSLRARLCSLHCRPGRCAVAVIPMHCLLLCDPAVINVYGAHCLVVFHRVSQARRRAHCPGVSTRLPRSPKVGSLGQPKTTDCLGLQLCKPCSVCVHRWQTSRLTWCRQVTPWRSNRNEACFQFLDP